MLLMQTESLDCFTISLYISLLQFCHPLSTPARSITLPLIINQLSISLDKIARSVRIHFFDFRRESSCDATCWRKTAVATSDSRIAFGTVVDRLVLQPSLFQPQQHLLFRRSWSRFSRCCCCHCRHHVWWHFNDVAADSGTPTATTVTVIYLFVQCGSRLFGRPEIACVDFYFARTTHTYSHTHRLVERAQRKAHQDRMRRVIRAATPRQPIEKHFFDRVEIAHLFSNSRDGTKVYLRGIKDIYDDTWNSLKK